MNGQHDPKRTGDESTTTVDLGIRYAASAAVPPPRRRPWYETPRAEEHVRARGRWLIIGGTVVGALTFAMSWVWFEGFGDDMPTGFLLPLYALSFGAIAVGGVEYLSRPMRYSFDVGLHRINDLERQVTTLVDLLDEKLKQRFYEGIAEGAKVRTQMTGTEHARPLEHNGEVLNFRPRN